MPGLSLKATISACLAIPFLTTGVAQDAAPVQSAVAAMRASFEATVASTLEPLNRQYAAALRRQEKELAIGKDYEAAIALRDERLAVEAMLSDAGAANGEVSTGSSDAGNVPAVPGMEFRFEASTARLFGGAERKGDAVNLSASGQAAEWEVSGLTSGGYDVIVTYACAAPSTFQVKEHFFRLACDAPASGGGETSKTQSFGTLKVTSRVSILTLTAESIPADSSLVIHEVKLISNRS